MEAFIHSILISFPTFALVLIIIAMLYFLSKGADILVDKAVSLSLHWGLSKMIIGATIVSIGTTLPEATVSVFAAVKGNPDLALGNAIGSIIVDTGLIIGLAAIIGTLPVDRMVVKRQGKLQLIAGILLAVVSIPIFSGGDRNISQWVGWLFIGLLITYIYISIKWSKNEGIEESGKKSAKNSSSEDDFITEEVLDTDKNGNVIVTILMLCLGIGLVIGSSNILIPSVEITAIRVGIPQSVIAATLIAFGTSLPELITAITAVRKGHGELAIGNIVGADILNVLFVVGGAAAVTSKGLDVPTNFYILQIPAMLIILLSFRLFTLSKNNKITKTNGIILVALYFTYLIANYTII